MAGAGRAARGDRPRNRPGRQYDGPAPGTARAIPWAHHPEDTA
ncbi:hypothetical protein SAZ_29515 [Streptomyces noursei ZPM]|nr:hypothetical protein SAZ_29515 [Streptomyces noursei ZPM]EPY93664.1 hypothetical protein K530_46870 [Streptomyces noursei CCRC 11814]